MSQPNLTNNDSNVLSALFDPEASLSRNASIDDTSPGGVEPGNLEYLQQLEREALDLVNTSDPALREIEQSVDRLSRILEEYPLYASAWSNRAQARRMLVQDEDLPSRPAAVRSIFEDLSQAIKLTTPSQMTSSISTSHAKVLSAAHTHRGYLLLLASKGEEHRIMLSRIPKLETLSCEQLEEAASRDFALGGRYGNDTARQLAVKTNPYAKLCGSIVKEALTKEISDFYRLQVQIAP